jgi:DNA-binding MarR family transcriptional regulator
MDSREAPRRLRALTSYAITLAATQAGQRAGEHVSRLGASKAAFGILAVIEEFGPSSQADLGRRLGMDRRSVSEEAARLGHSGLILRARDPSDSRRNRLEITSDGQALLFQLDASLSAMQEELLAPLSGPERIELVRLLGLINARFCDQEDPGADVTGEA